jgi:hypothetical protein
MPKRRISMACRRGYAAAPQTTRRRRIGPIDTGRPALYRRRRLGFAAALARIVVSGCEVLERWK